MAACGGPTSVSVAAFLGEGRRGPGALRRPVARRSGQHSAASGLPPRSQGIVGCSGVAPAAFATTGDRSGGGGVDGTWTAWHVADAGGCRPTAASGGPGCCSRLTGVLAPRVEACEEFCNSFGVPETSPLWRRLWSIGAWRSLASALDWGSRGRRFKSCRPDSPWITGRSRAVGEVVLNRPVSVAWRPVARPSLR